MLNNATIAQLRSLKLVGFADALQQQHEQADCLNLSFDERLALLVEREVYARSDRKRARLLQQAQLKYPSATLEDASFEGIRGMDRPALMGLALSTWIDRGETASSKQAKLFAGMIRSLNSSDIFTCRTRTETIPLNSLRAGYPAGEAAGARSARRTGHCSARRFEPTDNSSGVASGAFRVRGYEIGRSTYFFLRCVPANLRPTIGQAMDSRRDQYVRPCPDLNLLNVRVI